MDSSTTNIPPTTTGGGGNPSHSGPVVDENTDVKTISSAMLYDLNQGLLDDSVPVGPLIDEVAPMSVLRSEYEKGSVKFVEQIDWLQSRGYKSIRRTREEAVIAALSLLESTLTEMDKAGFHRIVFEDFYDALVALIANIVQPDAHGNTLTTASLLAAFQSLEVSNCIVVYMRLITSAHIRNDPDAFSAFLFDPDTGEQLSIKEFCERFVDAVGKEADHVQLTALSRALRINMAVAYLDGRATNGVVDFVEFTNSTTSGAQPLTLLYRPGHYDLLVSR
ncbi:peptidase C65 Otubain-domain-containing protein [Infundibulicybe gibba]|nr:peptidase C65 Otubain-domain-containing protein [Infundibulicybe gibba]